jgi:hypothetical protein
MGGSKTCPYRGQSARPPAENQMSIEILIDQAVILAYRLAAYAIVNLIDDAAMLALLFC